VRTHWKNDESRLKHHVLPELSDLPLAEVRVRHIVDLFHKQRTDRERNPAQRTTYNIYTVVSALFPGRKDDQDRCGQHIPVHPIFAEMMAIWAISESAFAAATLFGSPAVALWVRRA